MTLDRRSLLGAGAAAGLAVGVTAGTRPAMARASAPRRDTGLVSGSAIDQAPVLQQAIDAAAASGAPIELPPGRFRVGPLKLPAGTRLIGAAGTTTLEYAGGGSFITAEDTDHISIEGVALDGAYLPLDADGLIAITNARGVHLSRLTLTRSPANGISLSRCAGSVADCNITNAMQAAIRSMDAAGLELTHNDIADCGNAGIQVWRSDAGEDGSIVSANRIARIRADGGGSGQNGNGVSLFRAGSVLVSANRITDCAFTAVRGNAANDIQIIGNSCARLGEVAIYAEFGFEGALIANNIVDTAATGITVTNFNDGGRLAVVQGNLVRNLFRREHEPVDKRGHGITVEADTALTGNVIENAPTAGIVIGWGAYMREVVATSNLVRASKVGILVAADPGTGACLLASNMISGATNGSIRAMDSNGDPTGAELVQGGSSDKQLSISGNLSV
ncbi:TIGR03808 family TAT-translocated repetitive protein [Hyphomicrobium sp. NDB2Meth4]|uniref:TIGR03808 family TAT-translocated repetitive protein n=1 Tax=Hyphomicrobium sp. NDB2Meth4 TaxID=1892846 RepID=UPI000930376B|nr:TIGR03808 family TAT-translocated repetitive protein [Hyphomicrobium sp. NDB2Meth4]